MASRITGLPPESSQRISIVQQLHSVSNFEILYYFSFFRIKRILLFEIIILRKINHCFFLAHVTEKGRQK